MIRYGPKSFQSVRCYSSKRVNNPGMNADLPARKTKVDTFTNFANTKLPSRDYPKFANLEKKVSARTLRHHGDNTIKSKEGNELITYNSVNNSKIVLIFF
jgi:hypothetical protein